MLHRDTACKKCHGQKYNLDSKNKNGQEPKMNFDSKNKNRQEPTIAVINNKKSSSQFQQQIVHDINLGTRCKLQANGWPLPHSNLSICHLNLQKVMGLQESGAVVQHSAWSMR